MTRALLFSCLALALVTSACQDQKTEPTAPAAGVELKQASLPKLNRNHLRLPAKVRISDLQLGEAARRAIDPETTSVRRPPRSSTGIWAR